MKDSNSGKYICFHFIFWNNNFLLDLFWACFERDLVHSPHHLFSLIFNSQIYWVVVKGYWLSYFLLEKPISVLISLFKIIYFPYKGPFGRLTDFTLTDLSERQINVSIIFIFFHFRLLKTISINKDIGFIIFMINH